MRLAVYGNIAAPIIVAEKQTSQRRRIISARVDSPNDSEHERGGLPMSLNDFIAGLERRKLPFFHFTDSKNLALIRRHGLLSMRRLRRACIHVPAPGGNQWSQDADRIYGVDTFVHLSFMDGNPMIFYAMNEGRITDLKYLRIKPSVIRLPNTKITLDVSNKAGVVPRPAEELLANLDLEVMYTRTDWNDPLIKPRLLAARKCELLIPDHIPIEYIENL